MLEDALHTDNYAASEELRDKEPVEEMVPRRLTETEEADRQT